MSFALAVLLGFTASLVRLFHAGMRAGVQDFNVINLGDLEVKFSEGDEVSLATLQVQIRTRCILYVIVTLHGCRLSLNSGSRLCFAGHAPALSTSPCGRCCFSSSPSRILLMTCMVGLACRRSVSSICQAGMQSCH